MFVVFAGRVTGVYDTWKECEAQVYEFKNAVHGRFASKSEASAAFTRFTEERNLLNENAVTCPRCKKMWKAKISKSKPTIGQHVLTCEKVFFFQSKKRSSKRSHSKRSKN